MQETGRKQAGNKQDTGRTQAGNRQDESRKQARHKQETSGEPIKIKSDTCKKHARNKPGHRCEDTQVSHTRTTRLDSKLPTGVCLTTTHSGVV
eukprot:10511862-Alexandrium_andersonii.AAC.1